MAVMLSCMAAHSAHAQESDMVIINWTIEGQAQQQQPAPAEQEGKGAEAATEEQEQPGGQDGLLIVIERLPGDRDAEAQGGNETGFKYDHFVTGNEYAMGDYKISIFSKEGQILNQAIIDQRELQTDSFRHKIKYYDRFSDGYVEIAEALLDPIGKQTYHSRGATSDKPINTNLEIFLLERGYTLDDLQSIPNSVFSPAKFTLGRALLESAAHDGEGAGDLLAYSPNHMRFDESNIGGRMAESFAEQTALILGQVLFAPEEAAPATELYTLTPPPPQATGPEVAPNANSPQLQKESSSLPDALYAARTIQPAFENSDRVRFAVEYFEQEAGQAPPVPPSMQLLQEPASQHAALLITAAAAGLAALWYGARRARRGRAAVAAGPQPVPQHRKPEQKREQILRMLSAAQALHDAGRHKEAHESLGQAIRLFYSYWFGVRRRLTNADLLELMRTTPGHGASKDYERVRGWLAACGSVEYARHRSDAAMFSDMLERFSRMVERHHDRDM